jgi:hypothetical protein
VDENLKSKSLSDFSVPSVHPVVHDFRAFHSCSSEGVLARSHNKSFTTENTEETEIRNQ